MIHPISWTHEGRAAVWIILGFVAYALFCLAVARFMEWLSRQYPTVDEAAELAAELAQARAEWHREQEKRRLARLLEIADQVEAAPLKERQRLYREAESLGFIDQADEPRGAA